MFFFVFLEFFGFFAFLFFFAFLDLFGEDGWGGGSNESPYRILTTSSGLSRNSSRSPHVAQSNPYSPPKNDTYIYIYIDICINIYIYIDIEKTIAFKLH